MQSCAPTQLSGPPPYLAYMPDVAPSTKYGVAYMSYSLLMGVISYLAGGIYGILACINLTGAAIAGCGVMLLQLIWLILIFLALYQFRAGRDELGPEHRKNVDRSYLMMFIAGFLYLVVFLLFVNMSLVLRGPIKDPQEIASDLAVLYLAVLSVLLICGILQGLVLTRLVRSLQTPGDRVKCLAGTALYAASPVTGMAVVALVLYGTFPVESIFYTPYIGGLAGMMGCVLLYMVYRGIWNRMERGEIKQQPPGVSGPVGPAPVGPAPAAHLYGPPPRMP